MGKRPKKHPPPVEPRSKKRRIKEPVLDKRIKATIVKDASKRFKPFRPWEDAAPSSDSDAPGPSSRIRSRDTARFQPTFHSPSPPSDSEGSGGEGGRDSPESPRAQSPPFSASERYELINTSVRNWKRGPVTEKVFHVKVAPMTVTLANSFRRQIQLHSILEHAFRSILSQAPPDSSAQVVIQHPQLYKNVICTSRQRPNELEFDQLAERLIAVLLSDEDVQLEECQFYLTTFQRQTVGGRMSCKVAPTTRTRQVLSFKEMAKNWRTLYDPFTPLRGERKEEFRNLCFPLVLARELTHWEMMQNTDLTLRTIRLKMNQCTRTLACQQLARRLVQQAGLTPEDGPFEIEDLPAFENCLPDGVSLNIFTESGPPLYKLGHPSQDYQINIYLAFNNDLNASAGFHAYGISKIGRFLGCGNSRAKFCKQCFRVHYNEEKENMHRCEDAVCSQCSMSNCTNTDNNPLLLLEHECPICFRSFKTELCLKAHSCGSTTRCETCRQIYLARRPHTCGIRVCGWCRVPHDTWSLCYVDKPLNKEKKKKKRTKALTQDAATNVQEDGAEDESVYSLPVASGDEQVEEEEDDDGDDDDDGGDGDEAEEAGEGKKKKKKKMGIWFCDIESQIDDDAVKQHHANYIHCQRSDGLQSFTFCGTNAMTEYVSQIINKKSPMANAYHVFHNAGT